MTTAAEAIEATTKPIPAFHKPNQTRAAKRRRDLIAGLARDLGHAPSTAESALIEQAASLIVQREAMEAAMTAGEPVNGAEVTKVAGAVTRCLSALRGKFDGGSDRFAPMPWK